MPTSASLVTKRGAFRHARKISGRTCGQTFKESIDWYDHVKQIVQYHQNMEIEERKDANRSRPG